MGTQYFDNADTGSDAVVVRQAVKGGSSNNHALTLFQDATSGNGVALRVVSNNASQPSLIVDGTGEVVRVNGAYTIAAVPLAAAAASLPAGYGNSATATGLTISSSYPSDDVNGGTDGTGRINLYSYQRANTYSFGENIRHFLMRSDAKAMDAWYGPQQTGTQTEGFAVDRSWESSVTAKPWCWTGAHYEANDHGSIHGHWEVEVPDATGALQGRLEIPFIDQEGDTSVIGVAVTNIRTNLADLSVRANLGAAGTGYLRIGGGNSVNKELLLSISSDRAASGRRWGVRANTTTEAGSNLGTDFELVRYSDSGVELGAGMVIRRSSGQAAFGGSTVTGGSVRVNWATSGQHGFYAVPSSTPGSAAAFAALMTVNTDRAIDLRVSGDANARMIALVTGQIEWGDGTASRDTNLYRSAANVLKTDDKLITAVGLGVGNSAAATTPGTVTRKMEVFDASGSSLGFVPIYDAIT